jgi:hypothetical protein
MPQPLLLGALLASAVAGAEDLYPPAPPKDSAFVRVAQVDAGARPGKAAVGTHDLGTVGYGDVTAYVVVPGGAADTTLGSLSGKLDFSSGEFYTVAPVGGALQVIQDARSQSLAKASIQLYNFTGTAGARLTTGDGKVEIIKDVGAGAQGDRAVNALTTDLAVWLGDTQVATFPGVALERSRAYSAVLTDSPDGPKAVWIVNTTR